MKMQRNSLVRVVFTSRGKEEHVTCCSFHFLFSIRWLLSMSPLMPSRERHPLVEHYD